MLREGVVSDAVLPGPPGIVVGLTTPFVAVHLNVVPGIIWNAQLLLTNTLQDPVTPTNASVNEMLSIVLGVPGTTKFVVGASENENPSAAPGLCLFAPIVVRLLPNRYSSRYSGALGLAT